MDAVREAQPAAPPVQGAAAAHPAPVTRVALFPDISIGDAPVSVARK
jgi:hypothetical protein